ncbi:MAG: sugar phosphate isomerase/epimerase [Bryobacteraceae bacterium]|nr:sugar phosphate isomerase/epimerase [Bryobacteraceae bacterium]
MQRRDFLISAAGAAAILEAQPAAKLPIRKGILLGMLPRSLSIKQRFELARECGFESMECGTADNPSEAEEIRKASEETKFPVHSVMNRDHWQYPLSSSKPEVVERSVKGMMTSLDNAKLWGAGTVLLVPAVVNPETGYKQAWDRSVAEIRKLIPEAAKRNVIIAVENVWNKFLTSPIEFASYVDQFKSPWVRAYFDVGNVALYGFSQDWIRTLGSRIVKVHFKDFSFRRDQQLKKNVADWPNLLEGDLNWKEIHAALREIGYKGDATVELSGGDAAYLKDLSQRVDRILAGA